MSRIGVGIVGAGFVTQAIHLPVLSQLSDDFAVRRIVDLDADISSRVAAGHGAIASANFQDILDDSDIDVVAVCSPDRFHADQVVAACQAGKRAILCEKPLAVNLDQADAIMSAATASGSAIFVGTMHAHDPAYRAGLDAWRDAGAEAIHIRSSILLPKNEEFIDQATEMVRSTATRQASDLTGLDRDRALMRRAILGLAIHDIPLIRDFQTEVGELLSADVLSPFGYSMVCANEGLTTEMTAVMPGAWPPKWTFEAIGAHHRLSVEMTPSFVMAGSARVEFQTATKTVSFHTGHNGYRALWQSIKQTVSDDAPVPFPVATVIGDIKFALDLADSADRVLGGRE